MYNNILFLLPVITKKKKSEYNSVNIEDMLKNKLYLSFNFNFNYLISSSAIIIVNTIIL